MTPLLSTIYVQFCRRHVVGINLNIKHNSYHSCLLLRLGIQKLFHRRTRIAYLYNGCLAWYKVVLTSRVHLSVKYSQQSQLRSRATVE